MRKITLHNCTVELTLPDMEITEWSKDLFGKRMTVELRAKEYVDDMVVSALGHQDITFKKLYLRRACADVVPVAFDCKAVFFTVAEEIKPDAVVGDLIR